MSLPRPLKYIAFLLFPIVLLGCSAKAEPDIKAEKNIHVDILTISPSKLRLTNELPGRILALKEAEVRPQITGILKSQLFKEGSYVNSGDILYKIDSSLYQASVNSAKAQLNKAIANKKMKKIVEIRYGMLLRKKLTSQQIYDEANSTYQQAKEEVAIRQAELELANIQLSYTKIRAPISGRVGTSKVSEGSLLTAEQTTYLTTIIQSKKVYIEMKQSSISMYKLKQEYNNQSKDEPLIPVSATLEDGTKYNQIGYLDFTDAKVDDSTGSVTLRAIIPNPNHTLLPGMFVRANISMPEEKEYLVIPQSTVIRSQSGAPSVYIINDKGVTEKTSITIGKEVKNGWIIEKGLKIGDKLVVTNLLSVKDNQNIIVDNDIGLNINSLTVEKING